jgi:heme-degrading monooxygenase HmoA
MFCRGFGARVPIGRCGSDPPAALQTVEQPAEETEMQNETTSNRPVFARIWRGRTKAERADEYEAYNYEFGIKPLIEKACGVQTFRRDYGDETEFMTLSYWESVEAMTGFTGTDPTKVHHLDRDPEFLIDLPKEVEILRLRTSHGRIG